MLQSSLSWNDWSQSLLGCLTIFRFGFVQSDAVRKLRHRLDDLAIVDEMADEEKDLEKVMDLLFEYVFHFPPTIELRSLRFLCFSYLNSVAYIYSMTLFLVM